MIAPEDSLQPARARSTDISEFLNSESFSRASTVVRVCEQEDGQWDLPRVVISPGDTVQWSWTSDRALFPANPNDDWESDTQRAEGSYTHRFCHVGKFCLVGGLPDDPGCVVTVIQPSSSRATGLVLALFATALILSFGLPLALAKGLAELTQDEIVAAVMKKLGLNYVTLKIIVEDLIRNMVFFIYSAGLLLVLFAVVQAKKHLLWAVNKCTCCFKERKRCCSSSCERVWLGEVFDQYLMRCTEAGYAPLSRGILAVCSLVAVVALGAFVTRLVIVENRHSDSFVDFTAKLSTNLDAEVLQARLISSGFKTLLNVDSSCNCSLAPLAMQQQGVDVIHLADSHLKAVTGYAEAANTMVWVYSLYRSIFACASFECVGAVVAIGLTGLLSMRMEFLTKALWLATVVTFSLTFVYLGLNIALEGAVDATCDAFNFEEAAADPTLLLKSFLDPNGAVPNIIQMFTECEPSSVVGPTYLAGSEYLTPGISTTMQEMSALLPASLQGIAPAVPGNTSILSLTSFIESAVQSGIVDNAEAYGANHTTTALPSGPSAILLRAVQARVGLGILSSVAALSDCSILKRLVGVVVLDLCGDVSDSLRQVSIWCIVVLLTLVVCSLITQMQSHAMLNPNRRFRCPNALCSRWFRFHIGLVVHSKVGCSQADKFRAQHSSWLQNSGFHFQVFCTLAALQGVFLLISDTDREESAVGIIVASLIGTLSTLSEPVSLLSRVLRTISVVSSLCLVVVFALSANDNRKSAAACQNTVIWDVCTTGQRTAYVQWMLYESLSSAFSAIVATLGIVVTVANKTVEHTMCAKWSLSAGFKALQESDVDHARLEMKLSEPAEHSIPGSPVVRDSCELSMKKSNIAAQLAVTNSTRISVKKSFLQRLNTGMAVGSVLITVVLVVGYAVFVGMTIDSSSSLCNSISCDLTVNQAVFSMAYMSPAAIIEQNSTVEVFWESNATNITNYVNGTTILLNYTQEIFPIAQGTEVRGQLALGVRSLGVEAWPCPTNASEACVCQLNCMMGSMKLSEYLGSLTEFFQQSRYRNEVLVVVIDQFVETEAIQSAFQSADLDSRAYTPPNTVTGAFTWPTLGELVSAGTNLVVFADQANSTTWDPARLRKPWLLPTYSYIWSTSPVVSQGMVPSCAPYRGTNDTDTKLILLNWVATKPSPSASEAFFLNEKPQYLAGLETCLNSTAKRMPNFVAVSFASVHNPATHISQLKTLL
eukprot:TRINITY_DN671_c0_g1_i5.p1 TRINITY_DN671_c0_g1~~TRINITY_DN671_c0_g1_i5.p1  ORF type:complete len:1222 (-),score=171.56 TRINITY_DN671_c0_g1_i5:32-3697(-)